MDKNDLKQIGDLMDKKFKDQDTKFDKKFGDFEKRMKSNLLNLKSNIIKAIDISEKELSIGRELRAIASYRTADNTGRIEKLEERI